MNRLRLARVVAHGSLLAALSLADPYGAGRAVGQSLPPICGTESSDLPFPIGEPGAEGWINDRESLENLFAVRRYQFTVKEKGSAQVYVGDQWYNLNLGLFSVRDKNQVCWTVEARGTSVAAERRLLQFVRPDERVIDVDRGEYILTVRAGDAVGFDPSRPFTVRIAVTPRTCKLEPEDAIVEDRGLRLKQKVENPNKFQVGISVQPDDPGPFSLMSFNAYVSPPYTDLFDFTWEIDGEPVPDVAEPTFLRPFGDLKRTPDGQHTVKVTARGVREYRDPTEPRYNFVPFDGGHVTVACTFTASS